MQAQAHTDREVLGSGSTSGLCSQMGLKQTYILVFSPQNKQLIGVKFQKGDIFHIFNVPYIYFFCISSTFFK